MVNKHVSCHNYTREKLEETMENLKHWILIDSATTTSMGVNPEICTDIQAAENPTGIVSNGGELDLDFTANVNGVGRLPFNEDGITNLFGMNDLVERGFRVSMMDSDVENAIFVEKDNIVRKFITSNGGLYFHDLWNDDLCFKKEFTTEKFTTEYFQKKFTTE